SSRSRTLPLVVVGVSLVGTLFQDAVQTRMDLDDTAVSGLVHQMEVGAAAVDQQIGNQVALNPFTTLGLRTLVLGHHHNTLDHPVLAHIAVFVGQGVLGHDIGQGV